MRTLNWIICLCVLVSMCEVEARKKKNKDKNKEEPEEDKNKDKSDDDDEIITFAFSNDGFPTNYIKDGRLIGHSVDFTHAFCEHVGKTCRSVLVPRKQCWDSSGGFPPFSVALNRRYFSSCASFQISPERNMTYSFGEESYFRTEVPAIITAKTSSITLENLEECNDYKLAYPANTVLEPDCMLDSGYFVREENYIPVVTTDDFQLSSIMAAVTEKVVLGEAQLGLVQTRFTRTDEVRILAQLECTTQIQTGINNMFRKDDQGLIDWWNDKLLKFLCSKEYEDFCNDLRVSDKYEGADPLCRVPGEDLDCSAVGGPKAKPPNTNTAKRINPCISEVCRESKDLDYSTFRDNFYEFFSSSSEKEGNPEKALEGSGDRFSGSKEKNVNLVINTVDKSDDVTFRPDRICLTVKNVREIKFVFKGGSKETEDRNVEIDFRKEWTRHCESSQIFRDSIRIELKVTNKFIKFAGKKDQKIRVKDMFLKGCIKEAFVVEK